MPTYSTTEKMTTTARELIAATYAKYPDNLALRLAVPADGEETAIAWWSVEHNRWVTCAAYAITGQWVDYPFQMRINGELLIKEWREVAR